MLFLFKNAILLMLVLESVFFRAKNKELRIKKINPKTEVLICREYAMYAVKVKRLVTT